METMEQYRNLCNKYEEEVGALRIPPSEFPKYTTEELKDNFNKLSAADKRASEETLSVFNKKWYAPKDSDVYKRINDGFELGYLLFVTFENNFMHEFEKYKAVQLFVKKVEEEGKNLKEMITEYLSWNSNAVSRTAIEIVFRQYTQEIPDDVKLSFVESNSWKWHLSLINNLKG
jgi:hypothetical protein